MDDKALLCKSLRDWMTEAFGKENQSELARLSGVQQTAISAMLNTDISPRLDTIGKLAKAMRHETWELLAPPEASRLLRLFSQLSDEDRARLLDYSRFLLQGRQSDD